MSCLNPETPTIAHLIAQSIELGLTLELVPGGRIAIHGRTDATPASVINLLRENKSGVVAYLTAAESLKESREVCDLFVSKALELRYMPAWLVKGAEVIFYGAKPFWRVTWPVTVLLARMVDAAGLSDAEKASARIAIGEMWDYCDRRFAPHERILAERRKGAKLVEPEKPVELPALWLDGTTPKLEKFYERSVN